MTDPSSPASASLLERAETLATRWLTDDVGESSPLLTAAGGGRRFAIDAADAVLRPESQTAAAMLMRAATRTVPETLPWYVRGAVRVGGGVAPVMPAPAVPIVRRMLRERLRPLVADARPSKLDAELQRLSYGEPGVRLALTAGAGEVLGEAEARRRRDRLQDLVRRSDVAGVHAGVRELIGPTSDWAFDETVALAVEALEPLFLAATASGSTVTLDVREHRDLDLTIAVFTRLREDPRLARSRAGISLPASSSDAPGALAELTAWAQDRVLHGGAPITVHLAPGARAAQERTRAVMRGWRSTVPASSVDADAAWIRCIDAALHPDRTAAVRVVVDGQDARIAAFAWLLAQERGVTDAVGFTVPHGVGVDLMRALARETGGVELRVAAVEPADLGVAIGEVLRELDAVDAADPARFAAAVHRSAHVPRSTAPAQDRLAPVHESARPIVQAPAVEEHRTQAVLGITRGSDDQALFETAVYSSRQIDTDAGGALGFENAPDSDPSSAANREWARGVFAAMATPRPETRRQTPNLDDTVQRAREAGTRWARRPASERSEILLRSAVALEGRRGELIATAASEAGLLFAEADVEVSTAVDHARYCAALARDLDTVSGAAFEPRAVALRSASWREPIAEAAEGMFSALAAGSAVVVTVDPRARGCAALLAETLWQMGVPRDVLAVVEDEEEQEHETTLGGVGSVIVTPSADVDRAAADIVDGAFVRAGQRRTSASLVILVGSAGRSKRFARQLADAARSLHVGWPTDPRAQVGPLIDAPHGAARRALAELDDDEEWLVRPRLVGADPEGRLWSPGIRVGVRPGSGFLLDAAAAPVLGIAHALTLERAIEMHNAVGSGRVAGLHTQDPAELALWIDEIDAGTLRVNRSTAGAIVQRQPSGGAVSTGRPGGPNRLIALGTWRAEPPTSLSSTLHLRGLDSRITALIEAAQPSLDYTAFEWLRQAALSDALAWDREFGQVRDVSKLGVERNLLRYRPVAAEVRVGAQAPLQEVLRVVIAALRAGSPFVLSLAAGLPPAVRRTLTDLGVEVHVETEPEWVERGVRRAETGTPAERLRMVGAAVPEGLDAPAVVVDGDVTQAGRIELLTFVGEQSISITAHRFGAPDDWSAAVI